MDSAKAILHLIEVVTQQVRNATARYSTTKGVRKVRQHSLIRLESEFQTITNASRAIVKVLDDPLLSRHYLLDDRLVDWLSSTEPETCLDALTEMGKLVSIEREIQSFSGIIPTRPACEEDDIHAAIVLFHSHQSHFHFLLTTDIWNHGNEVHRQTTPSRTEAARVQGHGQPQSTRARDIARESQRKEIVSQKLKRLLRVLDALDCSEKHRETSSMRQSDTCIWLPATEAYRSWREGEGSFLWLQGKAGAGKSVLASFIINDLNNTIKDGELLVYFYCDFRTKRSTSAVEVMRSILAQLMTQLPVAKLDSDDLLDELLKESDSHVERFYNIKGLSRYLCKVAILFPGVPILVIDALDECREAESLLDGLIMSTSDLRIFATSRPLQNIINILSPFPCISMDKMADELSADILLHVTRELDSRRRLRTFDEMIKEEIGSKLCAKADGMFRWVQCQMDTLEKCSSVSEIRRVLESLPEGLEETYRRILVAIDRRLSDARLVRRALVWLVGALRPMYMRELREAVMIDPEYRALDSRFGLMKGVDLLDVCRSLVVHHEETDIITLSHMSVKEYLVGELAQVKLPTYHIVLEDAHELLARLCMAYIVLCLEEMRSSKRRLSIPTHGRDLRVTTVYASRPLLKYVLSNGFNHLSHLGSGNAGIFKDMETLQVITRRYAWEWDRMCKLVPSVRTGVPWPTSEHDFMLYTLIAFASDALFETLVRRTGLTSREGTNPLVYAAHFGKTAHARVLILQGADVNHPGLLVNDLDSDGPDEDNMAVPLEVAVDRWNAEIADLLLTHGAIIPDQLLARALEEQPHNFPLYIINFLLQTSEFLKWSINPWENRGLLEALVDDVEDHGQVDSTRDEVALALRRLVEVRCAEALLLVAVEKGCISVVEALLSMNISSSDLSSASHTHAIVDALAANGDTPLHLAVKLSDENRCLVITKLMVEAGFSPCERDADDKPPVHIAVVRGFISVVEYLLSKDVPLPSRILFAALHATLPKRVEMIRLLISKEANVRILSPDGDAMLHVAMRSLDRSVCPAIAKILIDAGCNPSARNPNGETPLCIAVKQEYHEIGNYLLLFGTSSDILSILHPDPSSRATALRLLVGNVDGSRFLPQEEGRLLEAIRQFLDDEGNYLALAERLVVASSDDWDTAGIFDNVVRRGFRRVAEYLLSQNMSLPRGILFTALRLQVSMIPSLIHKGADLHFKEQGNTLLHVLMDTFEEAQCLILMRVLVSAGCQPSTSNDDAQLPIEVAISRGFFSVVEYLLSQYMPVPRETILFAALRHQTTMVPFLIRKGFDLNAKDANGDTLLHVSMDTLKEDQCLTITQILVDDDESLVPLLIRKGADVHAKDNDGGTLFHATICRLEEARCLRTVKDLVSAGCNLFISNDAGQLPMDVAVSQGFVSVVEYFLSQRMVLPREILFTALRRKPSMIPFLICKGANLHAKEKDGDTLLQLPISTLKETQCYMTVQALVGAGCHAFTVNHTGQFPIDVGVSQGFISVVEYLLSQRIPLPQGVLFTALRHRASMVPFLLSKGADVHVQRNGGDTLLHIAMSISEESQCYMAVHALVQAGCPTSTSNAAGMRPIHVAVSQGFISVVSYLLSLAPDDSLPSDLLSSVSPRRNSVSMLRFLVDHGANAVHIDIAGNGLLHHVMRFSGEDTCLEATRVLVDAGCRHFAPNTSQETPLHAAVMRGFVSVAVYLISNDMPLPPDILSPALRSWPVYEVDHHKWKSMVTLFIRKGADVYARETNGDTLIHHATQLWPETLCLEVTELLVEAGCSISLPNADGELPVQTAVEIVMVSVVEYLLSHHAPYPPDILLTAVKAQHSSSQVPRMMSLLIRNGADVSVRATNGDSVLHVALARERYWYTRGSLLEVVKILVQAGCDPCARDSRGHTPLEIAITMGCSEVGSYFRACVSERQLSLDTPLPDPSLPIPKCPSTSCNSPSSSIVP